MKLLSRFAPREQILILIAAALAGVFILAQFIVLPSYRAGISAQGELAAAKRDFSIVSQGLPDMSARKGAASAAPKTAFNRNAAVYAARSSGVIISRIQPGADNAVQVWLEDSSAVNIYGFLSEIDRLYDANTTTAKLTRRGAGLVSAQFTFTPR